MQIGTIIRAHRLEKGLTQENVAQRLGVTAPAVNKWEKGHSMPDITLLSPLARLLDISLDTLLSHTAALPDEEANRLVMTAYEKLKTEPFDAVFLWAQAQLQAYPNSAFLSLNMARMLSSHLQMHETNGDEMYADYFVRCYQLALENGEDGLKREAADALYVHYMHSIQYEKAEEYLSYFSAENPERKRKLAAIYRKTGRKDDALRMYEELLYAGYQMLQSTFHGLYLFAAEDEDYEKAHQMVEKQTLLAQLFEMGTYHEISPGLELAALEQDADGLFEIMQQLLENTESIAGFTKSPLYSHMNLKQPHEHYYKEVRNTLLDFANDELLAFVQGDARFTDLFRHWRLQENDG
ncbi:helix-turn-helix domain-containing protein [Christensenellaceae bacterium OttesenSCG-928-L17]|nr:helix-turn-helix domain-containing protein [Christensenellaceae bacterium OttesenSCG-928-L17]